MNHDDPRDASRRGASVAAGAKDEPPTGRRRPIRSVVSAVVVVLVVVLATAGFQGWRDLAAARARERELAAEVAATEARIAALRVRIDRLRDDPITLERLAREEVGLVAPGDVVVVLPEPAPPTKP